MQRKFAITFLIIFTFSLWLSGCAEMAEVLKKSYQSQTGSRPEYNANNKVYEEFTDHKKYFSKLYNDELLGKKVKVNLVFTRFLGVSNLPITGEAGRKSKVVFMAQPQENLDGSQSSMKMVGMGVGQNYMIYGPVKDKDLVFNLKMGEPITVYGYVAMTTESYPNGMVIKKLFLFADKLEASKREK